MNQILTLARRELRAFFLSPVAIIFLATFLFVVLFSFFWVDTFFRRNIADVRPLFHWLPVLLIFLVSALTMRMWSEEQRMGTLEILLTLPVKTHRLVLGKFLAGLGLVAVALALTISLPFTVSSLGDLDWGPVVGGYLAALLLAAAYLSIGLCISATTDNPIVALILSGAACSGLYLLGSEGLTALAGNRMGEVLRLLGTGSRFESIQRGVIDLRDLAYYGSLCVGFLFLNTVILEAKRWSQGESTRPRRASLKLAAGLVIANLLVFNVAIAAVRTVRLDLTERSEYSISPATKKIIGGLGAPLLIRGYFSAKTHPLLAPLVPRVRDLLEEYAAVGGENVRTEFIDPRQNPSAEKEANEDFGIKSVPFQFADRHEAAVVNSYFNILIKYGDKYEKLGFQDLIEVNVSSHKDIEVRLRNLEYDLTRAIKKVVYGFRPLEDLFARMVDNVTLTAYITPDRLPEKLKDFPEKLEKVAKELKARSGGKFSYQVENPLKSDNPKARDELFSAYGIKPMVTSLFGGEVFYLHMLVKSGDAYQAIYPREEMKDADIKEEVTAALRRLSPGFLKTVGVLVPDPPKQPPMNPMMRRQMPPPQGPRFEMLKNKLQQNYTVKDVDLKEGRAPGDIDVLIVLAPENLTEKQLFAVDQFLMRGGALVICAGRFAMQPSPTTGNLGVKKVDPKLSSLLATWGIELLDELVMDPQNEAFPVPVERNVMGLRVREIRMINYPFWVDVRRTGMSDESVIVSGLPALTMQWASPLKVSQIEGVTHTTLLESSAQSWTQDDVDVQPNFADHPKDGFGAPEGAKLSSKVLAVAANGVFPSAFKGKPSPLAGGGDKDDKKAPSDSSNVLEKSPKSARVVVVASGNFLRDMVLGLSRQTGSERFNNNLRFAENVLDWSVADEDLLSIRTRGTYARTLNPIEDKSRSQWEFGNYIFVVLALAGVVLLSASKRRNFRPIPVDGDTPAATEASEE